MSLSRVPHAVGVQRRQIEGLGTISLFSRPGIAYDPGALVVVRAGSNLAEIPDPAAPRADLILMGTFVGTALFTAGSSADATTGAALDANGVAQKITVRPLSSEGTGDFSTGTGVNQITAADADDPAFMYDNDTYYKTDLGGTLSFGGWVQDVDNNTGKVTIKHSSSLRVLYQMYSAGQAAQGYTSDDSVLFAMTNLPAGTFSGGVWTATATGALNTTQDGLTVVHAVNDKVMFPPGTLTTLVVSAANSGPYECVTAGATGVAAVYKRTARFAHGALITPGTRIRVTLGGATTFSGTTWRADPTTSAKVVGTDDPLLFPERVIVQKTCASGTATIATVPLRAAGKFAVHVDWNGGTPAATATSVQATTQTPGAIGTASIIIFECVSLGTTVGTGTAQAAVTILQ